MKTRLNIICILIFIAIIATVANSIGSGMQDFIWGFKQGSGNVLEDRNVRPDNFSNDTFLSLKPEEIGAYTDSVLNTKTNEWMALQYREVVVRSEHTFLTPWKLVLVLFSVMIIAFSTIFQLVVFCRLIYVINKSRIFEWGNVLKLRLIGIAMIISFLVNILYKYTYHVSNVSYIKIPGYTITSESIWDFYQLIPGLGVLLMAEVFAIGLRLREEQELTI